MTFGPFRQAQIFLVGFNDQTVVSALYAGQPLVEVTSINLMPELFAQFFGDQPILRNVLQLGDIPTACLESVTAIEDSSFLEHQGVSVSGVARAFVKNISEGRWAQGGSTITQQLVKNYFLTSEKTISRKIKEMVMALLIESQFSKDEILQNYLNVIYLGQNGPFQIRGYGSAAQHFFEKPVSDLSLSECATLAALINSPGLYNPFTKPENAMNRRNIVLDRMAELGKIDEDQISVAKAEALPTKQQKTLSEPAPYYVQAVRRKISELGLESNAGLKVFTGLNTSAQEYAYQAVKKGLTQLEALPTIKKHSEQGAKLETFLISLDITTGQILALIGGRGYKDTQFNRALDAHRQVGSVMKPIVYLTALQNENVDGKPYSATTILPDEFKKYKYEGQEWSPKNYEGEYLGEVPMFYALKNSLNAPTAHLAMQVGLEKIIDTARSLGIESKIDPVPSMSLGSFELYPLEVLRAFTAIARMGSRIEPFYVQQIEDLNGEVLFAHELSEAQVIDAEDAAVLVSMLRQTTLTGTARSLSTWRSVGHDVAGKTGTTSDNKDTWFIGFTSKVLTVAWVGYDDNRATGLTGSSGALVIWSEFMRPWLKMIPPSPFHYPTDGVHPMILSASDLEDLVPKAKDFEKTDAELLVRDN
jgi:penicillin-binding protein 1B